MNVWRAVYRAAYDNGHDALVLGAMGCGAFGNDPKKVSQLFYDILKEEFEIQYQLFLSYRLHLIYVTLFNQESMNQLFKML